MGRKCPPIQSIMPKTDSTNPLTKKAVVLVTTLKSNKVEVYSTLSDALHDYPLLKEWNVSRRLRGDDKYYQDAHIKIERKPINRR